MQTLSGQGPANNLNSQSRTIAVIAIILFALAGLLSGFAIGAFIRPAQQQANNADKTLTPSQQGQDNTSTTKKHSAGPVFLGYPVVTQINQLETADGNTPYTFSAQIVDQSIDQSHGKPIHASDVTCKIWLTKHGNTAAVINADSQVRDMAIIKQPFPGEIINGLNFTTTSQTQFCNPDGQTTWNYTVSPTVDPGMYFIVVLADWKGIHFNWYSRAITIKNAH
ncbi:MAG: hypothetical protein NVS4B7_13370 [Ktedonobacteraceae bacterium]